MDFWGPHTSRKVACTTASTTMLKILSDIGSPESPPAPFLMVVHIIPWPAVPPSGCSSTSQVAVGYLPQFHTPTGIICTALFTESRRPSSHQRTPVTGVRGILIKYYGPNIHHISVVENIVSDMLSIFLSMSIKIIKYITSRVQG